MGSIGCFAMTELGHGSNVPGLETIAVFDQDKDEFVIESPTPTSAKWWIGGAAESATHAALFANLVVKGKKMGVKPIIVPLRDPATFALYPGIAIGDCGAKMGRNNIDNGWITFNHVRVPRSYLLQRFTQVSRQGELTEVPGAAQLAYGALVFVRTCIIRESAWTCKRAITIACRYACVRRQFEAPSNTITSEGDNDATSSSPSEQQIMDLPTHQHRLIPLLAFTYALAFTAIQTQTLYFSTMDLLNEASVNPERIQPAIDALKAAHGTLAGTKATATWRTAGLIERCRQACGGHGYSSYAGLANLFSDFVVQCTWEGDNTVLMLQTGRYLVGCWRDYHVRKRKNTPLDYLKRKFTPTTAEQSSIDVSSLDGIEALLDHGCQLLVAQAFQSVAKKDPSST